MLPHDAHGVGSEPKITRTFCFLKFKLSAPRSDAPQQLGSREKVIQPSRPSDLRQRPGLGCWFVTASQGGARETPRSLYALLWLLARRRRNLWQEIADPPEGGRKWESGCSRQSVQDRTHRRMQCVHAVSVQPLVRRGGLESSFRSAAVGAVTSMRGVADVASFEETVARSEWCEQVRDSR